MLKNFVIVKHLQDSGKYLFYVPKSISLEAGEKVVCDTNRGNDQLGVCCCDSFLSKPEIVCPLFGTQVTKMKYVTGRVTCEEFAEAKEDDDDEDGQQECGEQV